MSKIKPPARPFNAWAVYGPEGGVLWQTLDLLRSYAIARLYDAAITADTPEVYWRAAAKAGFTVRKVTVTADE